MAWTLVNKTPNTNLGYSYYPAVWEDSGKVYVKAQGESDINIYDVATDLWSTISLPATVNCQYFESVAIRHELMWVANGKLYVFASRASVDSVTTDALYLFSYNLTTGAFISSSDLTATFGAVAATTNHGNWGRNRHKAVIKDPVSGRIFLINFYTKQVFEFNASTETFLLMKTWSESIGGNTDDDVAGCDAVALNGMIYLLGAHVSAAHYQYAAYGPIQININQWSTATLSAYPDFAGQTSGSIYPHPSLYGTQWMAIGNYILGYGGTIYSFTLANSSTAAGNLLRKIQFDPSTNTWTDLGVTPASLLYAGSVSYGNSGYIFGGYDGGSATQKTGNLIYLLEAVDTIALAFDPADGSVTITWTDTSGQALTGYLVERREQQGSVWSTVGSGAAADRTMTDTTAVLGHDYYYQVRPYYVQVS